MRGRERRGGWVMVVKLLAGEWKNEEERVISIEVEGENLGLGLEKLRAFQ